MIAVRMETVAVTSTSTGNSDMDCWNTAQYLFFCAVLCGRLVVFVCFLWSWCQ